MDLHACLRGSALLPALLVSQFAHGVPLEVYGRLPHLEDVALSPDGSRIAFVRTTENTRIVAVASLADRKPLGGLRAGEEKLRAIEWADDDHVMVVTSVTGVPMGFLGMDSEWFFLQVYDVMAHKTKAVPSSDRISDSRVMNMISGRVMREAGPPCSASTSGQDRRPWLDEGHCAVRSGSWMRLDKLRRKRPITRGTSAGR